MKSVDVLSGHAKGVLGWMCFMDGLLAKTFLISNWYLLILACMVIRIMPGSKENHNMRVGDGNGWGGGKEGDHCA